MEMTESIIHGPKVITVGQVPGAIGELGRRIERRRIREWRAKRDTRTRLRRLCDFIGTLLWRKP